MQTGFEIEGAKSKKGLSADAPTKAPMAPRGPDRRTPTTDQLSARRQMAQRTAALGDPHTMTGTHVIVSDATGQVIDAGFQSAAEAEAFMDAYDVEAADAVVMTTADAIAHIAPKVASKTAGGSGSEFSYNGGVISSLWQSFKVWLLGVGGANDYADEYTFASLKESTMDPIVTEASILEEMAHATPDRQRVLARQLVALQHQKAAAFDADREIDLGGALVRDSLAPVVTAAVHTSATDWMGDDPNPDSADVQRAMAAAASRWHISVSAEVKADPEEYEIQATGMANAVAGQHAPLMDVAADAFVRHALFLNREPEAIAPTASLGTNPNVTPLVRRVVADTRTDAYDPEKRAESDKGMDLADRVREWESHGGELSGKPRPTASRTAAADEEVATDDESGDDGFGGKKAPPFGSKDAKTAADADINPYPANEQAGYAETGLPPTVPVDGYDEEGVVGDKGPEVAPENAAAVAEEGERTPMPGAGDAVTAGMRHIDTPLWGAILSAPPDQALQPTAAAGDPGDPGQCRHGWKSDECPYRYDDNAPMGACSKTSSKMAADGSTCATCGAAIERDPEGEANRTWHHADGSSHDHEAAPSGDSKEAVRTHVSWTQGVAPSGAEFFKANVDGYDIDVRALREGEGEPGWWTWSVTGTGANGPRNKHGQAANRDEAEELALGIVDNADGFTLESGKTAGTDPDDPNGNAESQLPTPEKDTTVLWPWELPSEGDVKTGDGAAAVADVPTPGQAVADYPKASSLVVSDPAALAAFRQRVAARRGA